MRDVSVSEKFALFMLKEKYSFNYLEFKIYFIGSVLIEMIMDGNLKIIDNINQKNKLFDSKYKVTLTTKAPNKEYSRVVYNYIKDLNKNEISLKDAIHYVLYGKYGFSDKKYRELVSLVKTSMISNNLINIDKKRGLFRTKDVILVNEDKFSSLIEEIREEFIEKDGYDDKTILLVSLLNLVNCLKNVMNKYEKSELKEKLAVIKDTDIYEYVGVAREVYTAIVAAIS